MKYYLVSICIIFLVAILTNCNNESPNAPKTILHPNNDSELTLLMREMYDFYDGLKMDIEKGAIPDNIRDFTEIHQAVATDPTKSNSELYKAMSTVYLESAKQLNSSKNNMSDVFNLMVDNCMNCHRQMCPGPMVKIKKLYMASSK